MQALKVFLKYKLVLDIKIGFFFSPYKLKEEKKQFVNPFFSTKLVWKLLLWKIDISLTRWETIKF